MTSDHAGPDPDTVLDHHHSAGPGGSWRLIAALLVPVAVITLTVMIWLWPTGGSDQDLPGGPDYVNGTILAVQETPCPAPPVGMEGSGILPTECGTVTVALDDGPDAGTQITTDIPAGPGAPRVTDGDEVVLLYLSDALDGRPYQISDHQRGTQLWMLAVAFALAVIAYGRWRGLRALAGLAVTFSVLLLFVVPAILDGKPPLLVAIVGSAAIMLTVLYLTHGVNLPTTVALLGTLASLALTGLLAAAATELTHLTGVVDEDSSFLSITHANVNMQGLLLAGILIGALGVLDDVTVTQAATVDELAGANPDLGAAELYRAANRVGRAHIASVTNTIILAYAGASLPLLLLITDSNYPLGAVVTNQLIGQEIVRGVVGTLGLIAAVPITTALAAFTARHRRRDVDASPTDPRTPRRRPPAQLDGWDDGHDVGTTPALEALSRSRQPHWPDR